MGAGCYKEKTLTISRDAILKAINDRYLHDTILTETINNNDFKPVKSMPSKQSQVRARSN